MRASRKIAIASIQPGAKRVSPKLDPDAQANLIEVKIGQAKDHLRARELGKAIDKCSEVIDAPDSSGEQRKEAYLVRGKSLVSFGMLSAAAFDFYKVLETDHSHSEAYDFILQIEADTGLPLTKR